MNEELLKLAYSKLNTDASFEDFKIDFQSNEDLQKLSYSKLNTDASFEDFKSDVFGQVKKKEDSEATVPGEGTVLRTPQQMEESTSAESLPEEKETLSESESADILKFIESKKEETPAVQEETVKDVTPPSEEGPALQLTPTTRTTPSEAFFNKSEDPIFQQQEAEREAMEIEEQNVFQSIKSAPITEEEIESEKARIESFKRYEYTGDEDEESLSILRQNSEDPFERGIGKVKDFFDQIEETAVPNLNKAFDQYGFRFEEALGFGDAIKVIAANGEEITLMQRGKDKYKQLEDFLNKNRIESTIIQNRINKLTGKGTEIKKRVLTEEELEEELLSE